MAQREKSAEMLRMKKAELQAQFDELSSSITNHTVFGQGRIIKAFPEMKHRDYFELIQELKKKLYIFLPSTLSKRWVRKFWVPSISTKREGIRENPGNNRI